MKRKNFTKKQKAVFANVLWLVSLSIFLLIFAVTLWQLSYLFLSHMDSLVNQVILLSLALYTISLLLPSYAQKSGDFNGRLIPIRYHTGGETLLSGLLLGWMSFLTGNTGAIAIYANLFYAYSVLELINLPNVLPFFSVILTLVLAVFSFVFRQIGSEISHPMSDRVTLWGWGFIIWLTSLAIVASLTIFSVFGWSIPSIFAYFVGFFLVVGFIAVIQLWRFYQANTLERKAYFGWGVALITKKMSGLPYNPPPTIPIKPDTVIELDTNVEIDFSKELRYQRYLPYAFNYQGTFYKNHYLSDYSNRLIEISPQQQAQYYYCFTNEKLSHDFLITANNARNQPLWHETVYYNEAERRYYPDYDDQLIKLFAPLSSSKKKNINALIDELIDEQFTSHTGNYHFELDKENQCLIFNNKKYIISGYYTNLEGLTLYCSANYAVIINSNITVAENKRLIINAWLFRLQPSKPLIYYQYFESYYDLFKKPENVDKLTVEGVRFGYYDHWNRHPNQDFIDKKDFLSVNAHYIPMLIVKTPYGELAVRSQSIGDVNIEE